MGARYVFPIPVQRRRRVSPLRAIVRRLHVGVPRIVMRERAILVSPRSHSRGCRSLRRILRRLIATTTVIDDAGRWQSRLARSRVALMLRRPEGHRFGRYCNETYSDTRESCQFEPNTTYLVEDCAYFAYVRAPKESRIVSVFSVSSSDDRALVAVLFGSCITSRATASYEVAGEFVGSADSMEVSAPRGPGLLLRRPASRED